jgi:hypothetical protein
MDTPWPVLNFPDSQDKQLFSDGLLCIVEYFPIPQSEQLVPPRLELYVPTAQLGQIDPNPMAVLNVPGIHWLHTVAAGVILYWPAVHAKQVVTPKLELYVPTIQLGQIDPNPMAVLKVPAVHIKHKVAAGVILYWPAKHELHVAILGAASAVEKVPEIQDWHDIPPMDVVYVPALHVKQATFKRTLVLYVPLVHIWHTVAPVTRLYFPAKQSKQVPTLIAARLVENVPDIQDKQMVDPNALV